MSIEHIDPELAAVLNRLQAPVSPARLGRMAAAVEAGLAPRFATGLTPRFLAFSAGGLAAAAVLGIWAGGYAGGALGPAASPVAMLMQLAAGAGGLT